MAMRAAATAPADWLLLLDVAADARREEAVELMEATPRRKDDNSITVVVGVVIQRTDPKQTPTVVQSLVCLGNIRS